ncbi:diguanylate cyclase [Vibrio sp. 404]|uniref:diguanylate cyclase n=1 Tax=Vibrio marinisediminis TaxID=2758441 RepID=A0A7W2ITX4_9VIBR|nr:GGDEF domain-containing protein [Vibrio marinisediminis]MBA5762940.1 diguanylate cyclase [Vibrio marinisediminis]
MKMLLAKVLALSSLFTSIHSYAQSDRAQWEEAYANALKSNEQRALSLLQDRYNSLQPGVEKLYVSSKLHGFMLLHGQPYYGNKNALYSEFTSKEERFVDALNSEEQLDFISARKGYLSLLQDADNINSLDGKILLEYHLCRVLNRQALYHQAEVYCSSLNTHIKDIKDPILPKYKALRVIGNNQEFIGNYQAALNSYQQLIAIVPNYVDSSGVYNDTGLLLSNLGHYEQAKKYINIALTMRNALGIPLKLAQTHHSMGKVTLQQKEYELATSHFMQSKLISQRYDYHYGITYAQLGLGQAHIGLGNFERGTRELLDALDSAAKQENAHIRGEIYLTLASAHQKQSKYIAALDFAHQALNLAETIRSERLSAQSLKTLAEISELQGNYSVALNYYRNYAKSELSKRDKENKSAFVALDATRRDYLNEIQTKNLSKENQKLREQNSSLEQYNDISGFAIGLLLMLILVLFAYQRRKTALLELDALSGALNRAACIRNIKKQPATNHPDYRSVLLLIDLDDFKGINDCYGHPTGDRALKHVIEIIKSQMNSRDITGRLGGEEFIVLFKDVDELDVQERVERLHQVIANTMFSSECRQSVKLTASISYLATTKALNDFDELYSILDQALYQAKRNGKNCVVDAYNDPIYLASSAYAPA